MTVTRQTFTFSGVTSAATDTGPPAMGAVVQQRWENLGTGDTGGDLAIFAQQREADTGDGVLIVNDNDILGADFTRQFRSPIHNTSGVAIDADTGDGFFSEPVVLSGERLRVRVTPAGGTVDGRLYVWIKD